MSVGPAIDRASRGTDHLRSHPRGDRRPGEVRASLARGFRRRSTRSTDHRFILTAGPYGEILPGRVIELTAAFIVAGSRAELQTNLTALEDRFHGRWANLDGSRFTGRAGRETCLTKDHAPFCFFSPMMVDDNCDERQTKIRRHAGCWNDFIDGYCPHDPCSRGQNRCCARRQVLTSECVFVDIDCDSVHAKRFGAETQIHWADTVTEVSSRPIAKRIAPEDRAVRWNGTTLPSCRRRTARCRRWRDIGCGGPRDGLGRPGRAVPSPSSGGWWPSCPFPGTVCRRPRSSSSMMRRPVLDQVPGPGDSLYAHYDVGSLSLRGLWSSRTGLPSSTM